MSLGLLALAVGTQIGKTQKSSYLRDIEEQKRQEQQKIDAKIAEEQRVYTLDMLKFEEQETIRLKNQKDLEKWQVTTKKNEEIANRLLAENYSNEETLKILEGMTNDKIQINTILNLLETKKKEKLALGRVDIKLKAEEFDELSPRRIAEQVKQYEALTSPVVEREGLLKDQAIKKTRADDLFRLTDDEFVNATIDNKVKTLTETGIAQGKVDVLNKISEYANTELQELINGVSAKKITSDTVAKGKADTVALIEKLSDKELEALQLLNSANKILSDADATTKAKIAEASNEKLNEILLANEKNVVLQGYDLALQNDIKKLNDDQYQALVNKVDANKILSKSKAEDQALLNKLNNTELQDKLLKLEKDQTLQAGELELMIELKKLKSTELQDLLLKTGMDKLRAEGILKNVLAFNLYKDQKIFDSELDEEEANLKKAIEENETIKKKYNYFYPDGLREEHPEKGKGFIIKKPSKYAGDNDKERNTNKVSELADIVAGGEWSNLMQYGTQEDIDEAQAELFGALNQYVMYNQVKVDEFTYSDPQILRLFPAFAQDQVAMDLVEKAQQGVRTQQALNFSRNNRISLDNVASVTWIAPDGMKTTMKAMKAEHVKTFNNLMNWRMQNGFVTQEQADAGDAFRYFDTQSLKFFTALLKPDDNFQHGVSLDYLKQANIFQQGTIKRPPQVFVRKLLAAGREAGFTNAGQYIDAISAGVGSTPQYENIKIGKRYDILKTNYGLEIEDIRVKANASTMLERALVSLISTYTQETINDVANDSSENMEYLSEVVADPNATNLTGTSLSAVTLITSKLPNAARAIMAEFGIKYEYDETTGEATVLSGTEDGVFAGFGSIISGNNELKDRYFKYDINNDRDKAYLEKEFARQKLVSPQMVINLLKATGKTNANDLTLDDWMEAERAASQRNSAKYNTYLRNYRDGSGAAKIQAKRDLITFVVAYQYASLLQGGTGGRTISDQDVENMLKALNAGKIADPVGTVTSLTEVLKQARFQGQISRAYLSGDQSQISAAYIFETEMANKVNFVYHSGDVDKLTEGRNFGGGQTYVSATGEVKSIPTDRYVTKNGVVMRKSDLEAQANAQSPKPISPEDALNQFNAGQEITVTKELLEAYPDALKGFKVGDKIRNKGI